MAKGDAAALAEHRRRIADEAEAKMAAASTQVEVVSIALATCDLLRPVLPVGGGFAVAGRAEPYAYAAVSALSRYPKERLMSTQEPARPLTQVSLAEQNRRDRMAVVDRINELVAERLRINEEVSGLRHALTALEAAGRHFAKHVNQLALPVGSPAPDEDESGDAASAQARADHLDELAAVDAEPAAVVDDEPLERRP